MQVGWAEALGVRAGGGAAARDAGLTSTHDLAFERLLEQAKSLGAEGDSSNAVSAGDQEAALRAAAQGFESFFIHQLIKGMRRTVPDGGLFDKGFAEEVYEDMLDQEMAENMAAASGIGLAEIVYDQLANGG